MSRSERVLKTLDIVELMKQELARERKVDEVSDYYVAKILQISQQTLSGWRCHGTVMSPEIAINAAKIANLDPEFLFACLEAERAERMKKDEVASVWAKMARACTHLAAPAVLTVALVAIPQLVQNIQVFAI